jgi:rhodanese-related sulfurtransferase
MGFIGNFLRKLGIIGEPPYQTMDASQVNQFKREHPEAQLLDVRTLQEHKSGHIPGSKFSDVLDGSFEKNLKGLNKQKPLIVYCRAGNRSAMACRNLKKMGFEDLYNLRGGYMSWRRWKDS